MKMVALIGSPRKGGNTDLLVDAFKEGAESRKARLKKVYLNRLDISGCQGCLSCHKTGMCKQKDDMQEVYKNMLESDVWVIATPVYWWGPTAQMKTAIDRMYCLCFGENPGIIEGKKVVLITASADVPKDAARHLLGMMRESFDFLKMKWAGQLLIQAHKKGEVAKKPGELRKASELGAKVAGA